MSGEPITLDAMPGTGAGALKSLVPSRDKQARVPDCPVQVAQLRQDTHRLAAYARVCGFTLRDAVPATWLHVQAFPLHLQVLGSSDASISLLGAVHVSNSMTMHRPVAVTEQLTLTVGAQHLRPHRRGALVDMVATATSGGETVWTGVSTYLASGMHVEGEPAPAEHEPWEPVSPHARWRVGAAMGREYRRVSGDPNPIHTSRIAARAFGFPKPIIHGMWTHARALAALEGRLPDGFSVDVDFIKPVLIPGTVGFVSSSNGERLSAAVTTKDGAEPHLRMRIEATS